MVLRFYMTVDTEAIAYFIDPCCCCKSSRTDCKQRVVQSRTVERIRQVAVLEYISTDTCRVEIQDGSSAPCAAVFGNGGYNHKER
jgi:hypothetical protein